MSKTCVVSWCGRTPPEIMITYGYCSYHYRVKNAGNDPEKYHIRKKAQSGELIKFVNNAVSSTSTNCILWPFATDDKGYGTVLYKKKRYKAHRLALILKEGIEPDSKTFACHKCDVAACINPKHIYWGDGKTNARDKHLFI